MLVADCTFRGTSGNALDVQAATVAIEDSTFVDNVSFDHTDSKLIDGVIVMESGAGGKPQAAVRMENSTFEASQDDEKRKENFGSDVGAVRDDARFYTDADPDDVNVNKNVQPLELSEAKDDDFLVEQHAALHRIKQVRAAAKIPVRVTCGSLPGAQSTVHADIPQRQARTALT